MIDNLTSVVKKIEKVNRTNRDVSDFIIKDVAESLDIIQFMYHMYQIDIFMTILLIDSYIMSFSGLKKNIVYTTLIEVNS